MVKDTIKVNDGLKIQVIDLKNNTSTEIKVEQKPIQVEVKSK
jgi:hypothetical protein